MKKLVILGGGYGGMKIVSKLLDSELPDDVQITLIDRNPYHSYKTEFYALAAGTIADINVRTNFPTHKQLQFKYGNIKKIDVFNQQIEMENEVEFVPYHYLVIGLGCEDNYHNVPGAEEFSNSVQTTANARRTGLAVGNLKAYGKVSIVGAGLSGIETASEIRESRADLNIRLLDRGASVLSAFDEKIQRYVEEWFAKNDVEIIHFADIERVESDKLLNKGSFFENDVTIWTAGVRPNRLVLALPFDKDKQDKIVLNNYYQVPSHRNTYVVGDCASSLHSPSAQLAGLQGEKIAEVLEAVLKGKDPVPPKELKLKGTLGSLGKSEGFGNMFKQPFTGLLPRLAKSGVLWRQKRH